MARDRERHEYSINIVVGFFSDTATSVRARGGSGPKAADLESCPEAGGYAAVRAAPKGLGLALTLTHLKPFVG